MVVHLAQNGIHHLAAHVLEVHVDAVGARRPELLIQIAGPVVHAGVETQFLGHEPALLRPAGHPHHPAAHDLADLARHRAGGPGGRRHHQGLARAGLADVEQAPVGGHAGGAKNAGERLQRQPQLHGDALGPVQHRVLLPDHARR